MVCDRLVTGLSLDAAVERFCDGFAESNVVPLVPAAAAAAAAAAGEAEKARALDTGRADECEMGGLLFKKFRPFTSSIRAPPSIVQTRRTSILAWRTIGLLDA